MKYLKSTVLLFLGTITTITFMGCASPGQKFIDLSFTKQFSRQHAGLIGIEPLTDNRKNMGEGYVGNRVLVDKSRETFLVQGLDVAESVTQVVRDYFHNLGFKTSEVTFDHTSAGVKNAPDEFAFLFTGSINKLECSALKKPGRTEVIVEIDLSFMLGDIKAQSLQNIPVSLTIERVEFSFDKIKVQTLLNKALEEALIKALPFDEEI